MSLLFLVNILCYKLRLQHLSMLVAVWSEHQPLLPNATTTSGSDSNQHSKCWRRQSKARYTPKPGRAKRCEAEPSKICLLSYWSQFALSRFCSLSVRRASSQFKLNQSHCQLKLFSAIMSSTLMMMLLNSSPLGDECAGERRRYWILNINKDHETSGQFVTLYEKLREDEGRFWRYYILHSGWCLFGM